MKEGKLVPSEVTIALLKNAMIKSGEKRFLIDGFPRALDQAEIFERDVKPAELVLYFDCPEPVMEERLLGRGKTSGRSDDNADTIKKRFHTFTQSSMPVIEYF
jgi:adenylate kinase